MNFLRAMRPRRGHLRTPFNLADARAKRVSGCVCDFRENDMTLSIAHLQPLVALIAGVLILIMPRLLNYIIAFYLIVTGIVGLGLFH